MTDHIDAYLHPVAYRPTWQQKIRQCIDSMAHLPTPVFNHRFPHPHPNCRSKLVHIGIASSGKAMAPEFLQRIHDRMHPRLIMDTEGGYRDHKTDLIIMDDLANTRKHFRRGLVDIIGTGKAKPKPKPIVPLPEPFDLWWRNNNNPEKESE